MPGDGLNQARGDWISRSVEVDRLLGYFLMIDFEVRYLQMYRRAVGTREGPRVVREYFDGVVRCQAATELIFLESRQVDEISTTTKALAMLHTLECEDFTK